MSSAGQANEAGSVARRGAATYFAVHMLATRPVDALVNHQNITHVAFESSDPTDDIILTFDGGGRAFVSAKRKVTYGKPFIDTVDGWVAQLEEDLTDNDLLVLVCEESSEWVRDLADALTKLRTGVSAHRQRHRSALKRLDDQVPADKRDEIYRRARIIELPRTATNNDGRTLLALMMDSLVENNAGSAAVSAISESVHDWAGSALGFDTDGLVGAIASRGIEVRADKNGPAAARVAAAKVALASYMDSLASSNGRIDLSLLADDLKPVIVANLLKNVRVETTDLKDEQRSDWDPRILLRRNRRMLMVGHPGSGKSLTMREFAGWCASDPDAPTPVPVHLPDLLPRHRDHSVTIEDLVTLAAKRGPKAGAQQVEQFLTEAVRKGDAILLLDGLDECGDKAAWMATQLQTLVDGLPHATAVVVATRATAQRAGTSIGLTRADLVRPGDLDSTIEAVLTQCAEVRVEDPRQRDRWLRIRRDWLTDARKNQAGMLQIPQLALLVTLIIGSTTELEIPKQRAELLHRAVQQSVRRWEHGRFSSGPKATWAHDLSPNMLLDGFVILGRLLEGRGTPPTQAEALEVLSDLLVDPDRWSLSGPKAQELATQILNFWDAHVAVFVLDEEDRLTSRSRVFIEIATAMWTNTCSNTILREWAADAVRYYDSEGVVALAMGLNSVLIEVLLDLGASMTEATFALVDAVRSAVVEVSPEQLDSLVQQLCQHANQIDSGTKEFPKRLTRKDHPLLDLIANRDNCGPGSWPLVEALCALNLGEAQRSQRDEALAQLNLPTPYDFIAAALVALVDAQDDERPLTTDEAAVVSTVLARDLPAESKFVKIDGVNTFISPKTPERGLGLVASRAIRFLPQLPADSAERIFHISRRVPHNDGGDIQIDLRHANVETSQWQPPNPLTGWLDTFTLETHEIRLLEDIESLGNTNVTLTKHDRWSLPALSDLFEATGYSHVGIPDIRAAFQQDEASLRRKWLSALGIAYGINLDLAAAQAALVRTQATDEINFPLDWGVISCRRFQRNELSDRTVLSAADQAALLECMQANSHWLAWPALYVLANTDPTWNTSAFYEIDRADWAPYRASECYFLSLLVSPEGQQLAERAAQSEEPARRHALQEALQYRTDLDPTGALAPRLRRDDDLWVRGDYAVEGLVALRWTCKFCGHPNAPDKRSCAKCEVTSRPDHKTKSKPS